MSEIMIISLLQRINGLKIEKKRLAREESNIQKEINIFENQLQTILDEMKNE